MFFNAADLFWLLLPLAAASGWFAARVDQRRRRARKRDLPAAYFKGLNFLLNEEPDKAIEVFVDVLEVGPDTVETHLSLGSLFRRRGEVERAIRIHQNLIARPVLDRQQRAQALLELGQDYLKAGLLDRAESLFLELAEVRAQSEAALRFLVGIYQQEHEWEDAMGAARRLARVSGQSQEGVIAQYYCEMAQDSMRQNDLRTAREQLKNALATDVMCVRASILLGQLEAREGHHRDAIKAWRQIEEQDPSYLGEVAAAMCESFRANGDAAGMYAFFESALRRYGSPALVVTFAEIVERNEGAPAAEAFLVKSLREQPSLAGLYRLVELNAAHASAAQAVDLDLLKALLKQLLANQSIYVCQHCGFRGRSLHWQCPSCSRWNTIKPRNEAKVA